MESLGKELENKKRIDERISLTIEQFNSLISKMSQILMPGIGLVYVDAEQIRKMCIFSKLFIHNHQHQLHLKEIIDAFQCFIQQLTLIQKMTNELDKHFDIDLKDRLETEHDLIVAMNKEIKPFLDSCIVAGQYMFGLVDYVIG